MTYVTVPNHSVLPEVRRHAQCDRSLRLRSQEVSKELAMTNVIVRTIDNRTRTPAEVKRLLHEIAFVLRSSRGIKLEILAGPRQTARPAESVAHAASSTACAA
jgi:hypothetical protein